MPKSERPADYAGGRQSQISGYYDPIPTPDSPSGWVYIVANNFDRSAPVELYRVTPQAFTDRASWQGWSGCREAAVGQAADAAVGRQVGEMSVRQIDGKTVLSYFNASTGNMEVRVADDPTRLGTAPVTTVVFATDVAGPGRRVAAARGQPAGPAVRRVHLAGLDARRVAGVRQPVEHVAAGRQCAVPRHPVRGESVQALISRGFCGFRPQGVRKLRRSAQRGPVLPPWCGRRRSAIGASRCPT